MSRLKYYFQFLPLYIIRKGNERKKGLRGLPLTSRRQRPTISVLLKHEKAGRMACLRRQFSTPSKLTNHAKKQTKSGLVQTRLRSGTGFFVLVQTRLRSGTGFFVLVQTRLRSGTGFFVLVQTRLRSGTGFFVLVQTRLRSATGHFALVQTRSYAGTGFYILVQTRLRSGTKNVAISLSLNFFLLQSFFYRYKVLVHILKSAWCRLIDCGISRHL